MPALRKRPAITTLPIVGVANRLATVVLFGVLVYLLGNLITMLEVWHRPPAHVGASAALNQPINGRKIIGNLPLAKETGCRILVVAVEGMGRVDSRVFCNGLPCLETDLRFDAQDRVVCSEMR